MSYREVSLGILLVFSLSSLYLHCTALHFIGSDGRAQANKPLHSLSMADDFYSYKKAKEDWVSNLKGTSMEEVLMTSLVFPASYLIHRTLSAALERAKFRLSSLSQYLLDYLFFCLIPLVCFCYPVILPGYLLVSVVFSSVLGFTAGAWKFFSTESLVFISQSRKPYMDAMRSALIILTAVAILAVDFVVFPRRFAKTESFGISLMDVGVGLFVAIAGMSSPLSRSHIAGYSRRSSIIQGMSPLLILWGVRLVSVKASSYQEHVSEYGVHWNFFLTLALLQGLSSLLLTLRLPTFGLAILAIAWLGWYQSMLTVWHWQEWVVGSVGRETLFTANREGIFSLSGFAVLYLLAVLLIRFVNRRGSETAAVEHRKRLLVLWIFALLLCIGVILVCNTESENWLSVSRRLANSPYVLYTLALFALQLVCFFTIDVTVLPTVSPLLQAVNFNGLAAFLLANLLTGLVNFSIQTLYVAPFPAFLILAAYLAALSAILQWCYYRKVSLKWW